jgi:hypothetical protein
MKSRRARFGFFRSDNHSNQPIKAGVGEVPRGERVPNGSCQKRATKSLELWPEPGSRDQTIQSQGAGDMATCRPPKAFEMFMSEF